MSAESKIYISRAHIYRVLAIFIVAAIYLIMCNVIIRVYLWK